MYTCLLMVALSNSRGSSGSFSSAAYVPDQRVHMGVASVFCPVWADKVCGVCLSQE